MTALHRSMTARTRALLLLRCTVIMRATAFRQKATLPYPVPIVPKKGRENPEGIRGDKVNKMVPHDYYTESLIKHGMINVPTKKKREYIKKELKSIRYPVAEWNDLTHMEPYSMLSKSSQQFNEHSAAVYGPLLVADPEDPSHLLVVDYSKTEKTNDDDQQLYGDMVKPRLVSRPIVSKTTEKWQDTPGIRSEISSEPLQETHSSSYLFSNDDETIYGSRLKYLPNSMKNLSKQCDDPTAEEFAGEIAKISAQSLRALDKATSSLSPVDQLNPNSPREAQIDEETVMNKKRAEKSTQKSRSSTGTGETTKKTVSAAVKCKTLEEKSTRVIQKRNGLKANTVVVDFSETENKSSSTTSNSRPVSSPSSSFPVVELKNEGDLKALPQAPLLNRMRPDYEESANKPLISGSVVLKICPEALMGKAVALEKYPSVTTILDVTMAPESRARLDKWKAGKVAELGEQGFKIYQQRIFSDGKGFHAAVEDVLNGADVDTVTVPDRNQGHWKSLRSVFRDISDVVSVEESINHPFLCYKGVTDCVISLEGQRSLVEWKTSSTRKDTVQALYDNPVQVAAYLGAVNFDERFADRKLQVSHGAVVVAYENGDPASVVRFDYNMMRTYWTLWLRRLHQYWRLAAIEKSLPKRKE